MTSHTFDIESVKRIVRSVLDSERRLKNPGPEMPSTSGGVNPEWEAFKNNYAGEVPAFGVVELSDWTQVEGAPIGTGYWTASRPSTTLRALYAVNSSRPVPEGGYGQCATWGFHVMLYDSAGSPAHGEGWGVKPGTFSLFKGYPSLCTVGKIVQAEKKWLQGDFGQINSLLCKAVADNAAGALATDGSDYKIMAGTGGSEADAGFVVVPAIYARATTANNEFFVAKLINNTWYAIQGGAAASHWLGKADSSISSGASGTISVWTGTAGSESDSGTNLTSVTNRTSVTIPISGWVHVVEINGNKYCEPWSC